MQCERVRELLSPYLDDELKGDEQRVVSKHLEGCPACTAIANEDRRIGRRIAEVGREPAPKGLAARIRTSLVEAEQSEATTTLAMPAASIWRLRPLLTQAASIVAVCALCVLATWWLVSSADQSAQLEREVLSAHVRSLLQDTPVQIASSDRHTVKPWFTGRVDFAPDVKDLAAEGFPLIGGRLDYLDGRRVGALVYKRRLHTINVFMWPSASREDTSPRLVVRNGYNLLTWRRNGITQWAISDLNAGELRELQSLL